MFILHLIDDNEILHEYSIIQYNLSRKGKDILLVLDTGHNTISYIIVSDCREPNIDLIYEYIDNKIDNAKEDKTRPLIIVEYVARCYIYIGDSDDKKQCTAHKQ